MYIYIFVCVCVCEGLGLNLLEPCSYVFGWFFHIFNKPKQNKTLSNKVDHHLS